MNGIVIAPNWTTFDELPKSFCLLHSGITNSFTRVLNLEKRNQVIRDDILEDAGLNPSYTRQTENDIASGKLDLDGQHGKVTSPPKSEWKKIVDNG